LELIFTIAILAIVSSIVVLKDTTSKLTQATNSILLHLNYTRFISLIDNKFDINNDEWFKQRWTLKFKNCNKTIGGLYYIVYSDTNHGGRANKSECLKEPLTNRYLYSNGCVEDSLNDKSKYILLTKEYGIKKVEVSCYSGSGLGFISFGADGKVYSKLGDNPKEITSPCKIHLYDDKDEISTIVIEPKTGYISVLN
jgi:hypothetical protein